MPIKCPSSLEDFGGNGRNEQTLGASARSAQRRMVYERKGKSRKRRWKSSLGARLRVGAFLREDT